MIRKERGGISELTHKFNELDRNSIIAGIRTAVEYEDNLARAIKVKTRDEER